LYYFVYFGFFGFTGMMHYSDFNPLGKYPDAIKAPVAYAFDIAGLRLGLVTLLPLLLQ
jgi:hypothetical protein